MTTASDREAPRTSWLPLAGQRAGIGGAAPLFLARHALLLLGLALLG